MNSQTILDAIRSEYTTHITLTQKDAKRFFKTEAGSYSEHDAFLGITVPNLRTIAKKYQDAPLEIIKDLLSSKFNEERLLALFILTHQYQKGNAAIKEQLCQFYLDNLACVNNWNLVDGSAHLILGHYINDKDTSILITLAHSPSLWERRVAIVATWHFIRQGKLDTTFHIATLLINDKHDLIHKAVGWMLREAGKRDQASLLSFLAQHAKNMPRTMLRYAMEKLTPEQKLTIENS